jgi:hypothetical protein
VDDISFTAGLSERLRSRVESAGRVCLSDDQAARLVETKTVHMCLWVLVITATILNGNGFGLPVFATLLGGLVEVARREGIETCGSRAKEIAKIIGRWLLGIIFGAVVMLFLIILL